MFALGVYSQSPRQDSGSGLSANTRNPLITFIVSPSWLRAVQIKQFTIIVANND